MTSGSDGPPRSTSGTPAPEASYPLHRPFATATAAEATRSKVDVGPPGLPVLPPLAALVEIALLIGIPALLDYFVPSFPSLSGLQPHPFWLPVLLLSLQYGTVSALLAAGCAIAASSILGLPDQEIGEDHFTYLLRVWSQPVLWLITALILGQFRMRQIERKQELARQVAELNMQRTAIADYAANLRERCERLERDIVGRRSMGGRDLLSLVHGLGAARGAAVQPGLGTLLEAAFGTCQASIALRMGDELRVVFRHGWPTEPRWHTSFATGDPIHHTIVMSHAGLCAMTPGDETRLAGEGIAATPILSRSDGRVIGMLKLELVDPAELDASLPARLAVLADLLAPLVEGGLLGAVAASGTPASSSLRTVSPAGDRPRAWRQIRWRRGSPETATPTRASRTG